MLARAGLQEFGPVELSAAELEKLQDLWRDKAETGGVIEPGEEIMGMTFSQPMSFEGFEATIQGSCGAAKVWLRAALFESPPLP